LILATDRAGTVNDAYAQFVRLKDETARLFTTGIHAGRPRWGIAKIMANETETLAQFTTVAPTASIFCGSEERFVAPDHDAEEPDDIGVQCITLARKLTYLSSA